MKLSAGSGFPWATPPVGEQQWEGGQAKLLLKALIARGCRNVPTEQLMDDLWPEGSARTVENNFRVTLHRARKSLEPEMDKELGSSYLLLSGNLLSLDESLCQVDVDEFLSLCRNAAKKEREGSIKEAFSLREQGNGALRGGFSSR